MPQRHSPPPPPPHGCDLQLTVLQLWEPTKNTHADHRAVSAGGKGLCCFWEMTARTLCSGVFNPLAFPVSTQHKMLHKALHPLALPLLLPPSQFSVRSLFPAPGSSAYSLPSNLLKHQTTSEDFPLCFSQFCSRFTLCEAACHRVGCPEMDSKMQTIRCNQWK